MQQNVTADTIPSIYNVKKRVFYNDLYFRLIACLIASHIIVAYGEPMSTFEIILTADYYAAFAGSFIIAFLLFSLLRSICITLDKKFDWKEQPTARVALQFFFGLVMPGLIAFMLASFYFWFRGVNIFATTYLRYDFQFILLQVLLINLYYIAYYFYARWSQAEQMLRSLGRYEESRSILEKETFQVWKGTQNLVLAVDDIAYWYRAGESNFLRTMAGEDFFISQSLDEVQQRLPDQKFFRANRQLIIHRKACKGFDLLTYGKLKAKVYPAYSSDVIISQKRALAFKNWIDSKAA